MKPKLMRSTKFGKKTSILLFVGFGATMLSSQSPKVGITKTNEIESGKNPQ